MYVREIGDAGRPAVVLLHGQVFDGEMWGPLARRLAVTRRVLVPDLPGYGRSPLAGPFSLAIVRRDLLAALAERGVRQAALVGFSLGAYQALAIALDRELDVSRLALLAPAGGFSAEDRATFAGFAQLARTTTPLGPIAVGRFHAPAFVAAHPEIAQRTARLADATPREVLALECDAIATLTDDLRLRAGELRLPVLVRTGSEDVATPVSTHGRPIASAIAGAVLEVPTGLGHLQLVEDERGTVDSVATFLGA